MTDRPPKLHRAVKPLALQEPRLSSAEIYERLKPDWQHVNQQWLRRNIVSYAASIRKQAFPSKKGYVVRLDKPGPPVLNPDADNAPPAEMHLTGGR